MTNASNSPTPYVPPVGEVVVASVDGPVVSDPRTIVDEAADRLGAVIRERFGTPLPQRDPVAGAARARFIATLHALIAYVLEHPELGTPWSCSLSFHVEDADQLAAAVAALEDASLHPDRRGAVVFRPVESEFYTPVSTSIPDALDRPL